MSLAGRSVLVARPTGQCGRLLALLREAGARATHFPVMELEADPVALDALPDAADKADWLVFVSPGVIDLAWPRLAGHPVAARLACVGAASAAKLAALSGLPVTHPSDGSDSEALLALPEFAQMAGQRVLIVRGEGGRATLAETLTERGANVSFAEVYRRVDASPDWKDFDRHHPQAVILTSSDMVERWFRLAGPSRAAQLQCLLYCVPHPRIAERLAGHGATRIVTTRAGDDALVAGLREWFSRHP
ncbi:uroporphyrinogen-III synthase [Paludibacterium paludis]|uniref:Uroporphyrinogen-III synthase n=1 Tax=Paludibacterium paludis TaxID=1225769 RepID=A0A918U8F5_9NEIS|nr:uroporphyrinogen-III synthase [Paludibacterium paludis]GGY09012.1 uroporphyrinogen-III synthase [Paludibacterium paludis]